QRSRYFSLCPLLMSLELLIKRQHLRRRTSNISHENNVAGCGKNIEPAHEEDVAGNVPDRTKLGEHSRRTRRTREDNAPKHIVVCLVASRICLNGNDPVAHV